MGVTDVKVGFFTDTYFPQISGVATSIKTLKEELEKNGHTVYIFTTTDPKAREYEEGIIRMPSIPFISFKDRRIVIRGMIYAYSMAKEIGLDIIHTHTEFGTGWLGKVTAKRLGIPNVHTYHTMYEDYLHYIANGKIIRPYHVRQASRAFCRHLSGIVCPSDRVVETLNGYEIIAPKAIIPTGVNLSKFTREETNTDQNVREELGIQESEIMLLSLSRLSYEKNIQQVVKGMPEILEAYPQTKLVIVGGGPYREELETLVTELEITESVYFVGEVNNEEVARYYRAANFFVSASDSESQGLTYIESIAAHTKAVVKGNEYINGLFDDHVLGKTYENDEDFAQTLIAYIALEVEDNPSLREAKLYEISSINFGHQIEKFYHDAQDYYGHYIEGVEEDDFEDDKNNFAVRLFKRW